MATRARSQGLRAELERAGSASTVTVPFFRPALPIASSENGGCAADKLLSSEVGRRSRAALADLPDWNAGLLGLIGEIGLKHYVRVLRMDLVEPVPDQQMMIELKPAPVRAILGR
jgi:hypothetical protein